MNQSGVFAAIRAFLEAFKEPQDENVYEATSTLIQGALTQAAVIQFGNHVKAVEGKYFLREDVDIEELWEKLLEVSR